MRKSLCSHSTCAYRERYELALRDATPRMTSSEPTAPPVGPSKPRLAQVIERWMKGMLVQQEPVVVGGVQPNAACRNDDQGEKQRRQSSNGNAFSSTAMHLTCRVSVRPSSLPSTTIVLVHVYVDLKTRHTFAATCAFGCSQFQENTHLIREDSYLLIRSL
jgi:hypothetical protein